MHEVREGALRLSGQFDHREALEDFFPHDLQLQFAQAVAHATVDAEAEGDVLAIVCAVGVMMFAAKGIGDFVEAHPSVKMLALSFLVVVGTVLVADGMGFHVPKGYIYFSMAFSLAVEGLNIRMRKKKKVLV